MIDRRATRRNVLEDVHDVAASVPNPRMKLGLAFGRRRRHQLKQLLVLLLAAVFGQLFDDMRAGQRGDLQVVSESSAICRRAREWMLLAAVGIGVDQREDRVQIGIASFSQALDQIGVIDWIHGDMITGLVAHLRSLQVEFDVHAGATAGLVQLAVDFDRGEVRIFGIERRALVGERMETCNFSGV